MQNLSKFVKPLALVCLAFFAFILLGSLLNYFSGFEKSSRTDYKIGYDPSWYPLELYEKNQYFTKFSRAIVETIGGEEHFHVEFGEVVNEKFALGLDRGIYDGVLTSAENPHDELVAKYIFSQPYYHLGTLLVTTTSSLVKPLGQWDDKTNLTIGVVRGSNAVLLLNKYSGINFVLYEDGNTNTMVTDLVNNKLDGVLLDMIFANSIKKSGLYHDALQIDPNPLGTQGLYLMAADTSKGQELIKRFNSGLEKMQHDGRYEKLVEEWGLFNKGNWQIKQ